MATKHVDTPGKAVQVEPTEQDDVDVEETSQRADVEEIEQTQDRREGKKEGTTLRDREPGKSVLPFTRVQKIMKADKDLPIVAKDATFLISLATEEFIKRLAQACQRVAEREKRTIVQQRDVASIVRRADEFLFLGGGFTLSPDRVGTPQTLLMSTVAEILGSQESTGKRKPQKTKSDTGIPGGQDESQPSLRNFMQKSGENEDMVETNNIVVNEDGVMYTE